MRNVQCKTEKEKRTRISNSNCEMQNIVQQFTSYFFELKKREVEIKKK